MKRGIAVIGGGPAGASAALELTKLGVDAVVLERSDGCGNPIGECLAPTINPLLHRLGLHSLLLGAGALPSHGNRSSWGGDGAPAERDFLREPFGHGWHLDRSAFNAALLKHVECAGVPVWRGARVQSVQRGDDGWSLGIKTPRGPCTLSARGIIDASGRAAVVSRQRGIRRRRFDGQVAAVGLLGPAPGAAPLRDATTVIEAVANGWWYAALLPDGRLVTTFFTDPDLLAAADAWRAAGWKQQLDATVVVRELVAAHGYCLPDLVRPLGAGSSLLTATTGVGWVAAGDAAAAYDPLSSHGIGSALATGQQAAVALVAALGGDAAALPAYAERMRASYARYLWLRHAYYADERRWLAAPFWARRHGDNSDLGLAATLQGSARQL